MQQVYLDHTVLCVLVSKPSKAQDGVVHALELGLRRAELKPLTSSHSLSLALQKIRELCLESVSVETETRLIANWSRLCHLRTVGPSELSHAARLHESFLIPRHFALEAALASSDGETSLLTLCPEVYAEAPLKLFS